MRSKTRWENRYKKLIKEILTVGSVKHGRNGFTNSLFGASFHFNLHVDGFPIIRGRRMYHKGVMGELAAFLKGPKSVKDFVREGCNFWELWGAKDGSLNIDYGNLWLDFNGVNQLKNLVEEIKTNPNSRRLIVTGWKPDNLDKLSLPCCHVMYQWSVRNNTYLDMVWTQRSADVMIGLPSDMISAAALNIIIAEETGLIPAKVTMNIGDAHIYFEHVEGANEYLKRPLDTRTTSYCVRQYTRLNNFNKDSITLVGYESDEQIKFKLKV